jgi:hypothetical protein
LSSQEKAVIAAEVKYGSDIDAGCWRESSSLDVFDERMSTLLPALYKVFNGIDVPEINREPAQPDKQGDRTHGEKESVLARIKQDKLNKRAAAKQPQEKIKIKKPMKGESER